jgi:hypothetical protein
VVIEGRPKAGLVRTPSQSPGTDLCSTKSIFCALSADCAPCAIVTNLVGTVPTRNHLALRQMVENVGGSPISAENLWRARPVAQN